MTRPVVTSEEDVDSAAETYEWVTSLVLIALWRILAVVGTPIAAYLLYKRDPDMVTIGAALIFAVPTLAVAFVLFAHAARALASVLTWWYRRDLHRELELFK